MPLNIGCHIIEKGCGCQTEAEIKPYSTEFSPEVSSPTRSVVNFQSTCMSKTCEPERTFKTNCKCHMIFERSKYYVKYMKTKKIYEEKKKKFVYLFWIYNCS